MPNDSQETQAGPLNGGVTFCISDGSAENEHKVQILQPDLVKRWSLGFKNLMDGKDPNQEILIKLDPGSDLDCASVGWVLENYPEKSPDVTPDVTPDPKTLARNCAVLWKFECIPDSFKDLGENMQPRSSSNSLSGRKKNSTCRELIVIAIVLGLEKKLEDEIKNAVWGTSKKMGIAELPGIEFDLELLRKNELGELFDHVCKEIFEIHGENDKQAKSIQEILKQHKLGNFSKLWEKSAKDFEAWTPYDFLRAMENALTPPEQQTQSRESPAPVGPKELPNINWVNAIKKMKKATKDTLQIVHNKEIVGDQERKNAILKSLKDLAGKRRKEAKKFAANLIRKGMQLSKSGK